MAIGVKQLNTHQIEDSLSRLRDVYAARVSLNTACDDVDEIHVLASPSRTPKQIVRDIESLLFVKFRTRIDYRRVSLAQVSTQDLTPHFKRPKLLSVNQDTEDGASVEVRLAYGDGVNAVGKAHVGDDGLGVCQMAALATTQALSGIVNNGEQIAVQGAEAIPFSGGTVALVHLTRQIDHHEEHLLGASLAGSDVILGTVRATLDAVNRRLF